MYSFRTKMTIIPTNFLVLYSHNKETATRKGGVYTGGIRLRSIATAKFLYSPAEREETHCFPTTGNTNVIE